MSSALNIFYNEPDLDRWFKFDRYPRKIIRRIIRGKRRPGGVETIALNLLAGLKILNIPYRYNDYQYIKKYPNEWACIIGKPQILFEKKWSNPILFGAGVYSHPTVCPDLFQKIPQVKHILVPGDWMCKMFEPYYGNKVSAWPTGIDTERWKPSIEKRKFDFLIYNKIRWDYPYYEKELLNPIKEILKANGLNFHEIKYGNYELSELDAKLKSSKAVVFLCEHETQGIAYQQILSTNTPILSWDRGGFWQDPSFYPKIQFKEVSSVPYWDNGCGIKFRGIFDFKKSLIEFLNKQEKHFFTPRKYILENLSLQICAEKYFQIVQMLKQN